jgi:hypothetical protein
LKLCFSQAKGLWHYKYKSQCMHKRGGDYIEKKQRKKNKWEKQGDDKWENRGENPKKKPRTEGGEIEKRRRRRAFSNRCLHHSLCLRLWLHQVKSFSSLCLCVIVVRKQCEGNLITFVLCSARVGWATRAYCPAGSLAPSQWPAGSSPC